MKKSVIQNKFKQAVVALFLVGSIILVVSSCQRNALNNQSKHVTLSGTPSATIHEKSQMNDSQKVLTVAEQMPQFSGGEAALMKFLHDHLHYPAEAKNKGIQGTIVVQFNVNLDGSLSNVKTIGSVKGGGLEQEAISAVKAMPHWNPGRQNGHKVTVQYNLPIRFVINAKTLTSGKKVPPPPPPPSSPPIK